MWATKHRPSKLSHLGGQPVAQGVISGVLLKYNADPLSLPSCMKFYGQSGCGKTTAARLQALYLNCVKGPTKACRKCESCTALFEDRHPDVHEVDAATYNTEIHVAELLEYLQYPVKHRVRVFILDECHLFTKGAWTSLLKVIEEAPKDVLFILCTTEVHKIPKAIMGRGFNLKYNHIGDDAIIERLAYILKVEKLPEVAPEILQFIARKSSGHMRDAINYLEQAYLLSRQDTITVDHVALAIGVTPEEQLRPILNAILTQDQPGLIKALHAINKWTPRTVCQSLIDYLEMEIYRRMSTTESQYPGENTQVVDLMNLLQQHLIHFKTTETNIYYLVMMYYVLWDIKTMVIK